MLGLLGLLREITAALHGLGSNDIDLYRLRVCLAAMFILENPGLVPFERSDYDGDYIAPAEEGERLAAELAAAGQRIFIESSDYHDLVEPANALLERIGPLRTDDQTFVRYDVFQTRAADWLKIDMTTAPGVGAPLLSLPVGSSRSADGRTITITPGTVWIARTQFVPGSHGFVGLRVTEGQVMLDAPLPDPADGVSTLAAGATWRLRLTPEQASGGRQSEPAIALPELVLASNGLLSLSGSASITTPFGTVDLIQAATPILSSGGIAIPLGGTGKVEIATPPASQLRLRSTHDVAGAAWLLPGAAGDAFLGEAQDSGTLSLTLASGESGATLSDTSAALGWQAGELQLSASRSVWRVPAATGFGTIDLELWDGGRAAFGLGDGERPISLAWTLEGGLQAVLNGTLATGADLPLAADGKPFDISEANRATIGIARLAGGDFATTVQSWLSDGEIARQPRRGLAFPNLYMCVRGPRHLLLGGTGPFAGITTGESWLRFDALGAEPILPDPYAANWNAAPPATDEPRPIDMSVRWDEHSPPEVRTTLGSLPPWPQPHGSRSSSTEADQDFIEYVASLGGEIGLGRGLKLLDLSSNAQRFGVELDSSGLGDGKLGADALLALPMTSARLFLLPQVHWETVVNFNNDMIGPQIGSASQGMPTFATAIATTRVRTLPEEIAQHIAGASREEIGAAALFSLPFGQRAFTDLGPDRDGGERFCE